MMRRGLGRGKGSGWKNIMSDDAFRHKLAKFGIRTVQSPFKKDRNRLPLQLALAVPSTRNVMKGKKLKSIVIPRKEFNKRIDDEKEWFDKKFDGDTAVRGMGSFWDNKLKKLTKENVVLVESSTSLGKFNEVGKEFAEHARRRQTDWEQSSILVRVEGQDFIVPKQSFLKDDKKQKNIIAVE
jgi:hypothetical protein